MTTEDLKHLEIECRANNGQFSEIEFQNLDSLTLSPSWFINAAKATYSKCFRQPCVGVVLIFLRRLWG